MTKKVIIVDNDASFVEPLVRHLSSFDVDIKWFKEAGEFIKEMKSDKPDLYIIAVELPDGNGFSLCKKVKENPVLAKIPVMLVLRKENLEMAKNHQKLKVRADAYFTKPIDPKQFVGHMEDVMRTPLKRRKEKKEEEVEVEISAPESVEEKPPASEVSVSAVEEEELDEEINRFIQRFSEVKRKLVNVQKKNEELRKELRIRDNEVESLKRKLRGLEDELDMRNRKVQELESEVASLERKVAYAEDELNKVKELKNNLENKLRSVTHQADKLREEIEKMKKKVEKEEAEKSMLAKEREKLKAEVSTLVEREKRILKEKKEVEEEKRRLEEMLANLQEDKKVLEKALSELKEEKEMLQKRIESLEAEKETFAVSSVEPVAVEEPQERASESEEEWFKPEDAIGKIESMGEDVADEKVEEVEEIEEIEEGKEGVEEAEVKLPEEESILGEDEEISKAIDDFFTQTEFATKDSFEEALNFMVESAKEELDSMTTSEEKILQKVAKIVDIYNHLFRYIFEKMKEHMPSSDPQKIFNDYFTDLKDEKSEIFKDVSFNERGELNSLTVARNTVEFTKEMSIPKTEIDRTAVSIISEVMSELLDFVKFTFSNILPDEVSEDINNKAELVTSKISKVRS